MRKLFGRGTLHAALGCAWLCWLAAGAAGEPGPAGAGARVERVTVESSSLSSIGFTRETRVLEIEFRSGALYRYHGVPRAVFEDSKKAESKGRYFSQFIRGKYRFQRIDTAAK